MGESLFGNYLLCLLTEYAKVHLWCWNKPEAQPENLPTINLGE